MIKPILFSGPMVKAILDGDKTMTRRVIKPQPKCRLYYAYAAGRKRDIGKWLYPSQYAMERDGINPPPEGFAAADRDTLWTPPCHGDDILWVRETWTSINNIVSGEKIYLYKADDALTECLFEGDEEIKWRPSMYMPREAARIFLRVTKVSVERLQEISGADITCEGVGNGAFFDTLTDRAAFRELWDGLRKPDDLKEYGWKANPWVWVILFERCEKPEAW